MRNIAAAVLLFLPLTGLTVTSRNGPAAASSGAAEVQQHPADFVVDQSHSESRHSPKIIDVSAFPYCARGDGSDETAKIQDAIADLSDSGGGTLWFPRGTYGVRSVPGSVSSTLFTFSNLSRVRISGDGATIKDLTTYYAAVVSLTSAGTTATVTTAEPNGFSTGNFVTIYGASPDSYNGTFRIRVQSPTSFTYTFAGGTSPAPGTIQAVTDGTLFRFSGCTNISIEGLSFTAPRKPDYDSPHGLYFIALSKASSMARIDAAFDGGFAAVNPTKQPRDPEADRSSSIRAEIIADHVERPYFTFFSGDHCDIRIHANWSGRDFILVGARTTNIDVESTDQQGASALDQLSGAANEDLDLYVRNRSSFRQNSQNPQLIIQWGDVIPAAIRRVRIVFDVVYNGQAGSAPFGAALGIWKLGPTKTPDNVPRGHVIDGLDVSGTIQPWAGRDIINMKGAFSADGPLPDLIRGVRFHDILCGSSSTMHPNGINFAAGNALQDAMELTNIYAPVATINVTNTTGRVVQRGVVAYDLTASVDDESPQDYIDCVARSGKTTSTRNKRILRTSIGGN